MPPSESNATHERLSRRLSRILSETPPAGGVTMNHLLALPRPSAPVFPSNGLPACAVIVLAAAMMAADGVLIWVGYGMALATVIFFLSIAETVIEVFARVFAGS